MYLTWRNKYICKINVRAFWLPLPEPTFKYWISCLGRKKLKVCKTIRSQAKGLLRVTEGRETGESIHLLILFFGAWRCAGYRQCPSLLKCCTMWLLFLEDPWEPGISPGQGDCQVLREKPAYGLLCLSPLSTLRNSIHQENRHMDHWQPNSQHQKVICVFHDKSQATRMMK